ncbi:hypothetical protein [Isoptericola sp. AK164]|uniref:hypothetical protein n=1 Tax=Isoptericola sp. AK164 TaxID=3024246 RepID=UPI0024184B54|nr:hypothetical protein [Isoptericola sp. AK164]
MTHSRQPTSSRTVGAWVAAALVLVGFLLGLVLSYVLEGVLAGSTVGDERSLTADLVGALLTIVLVLVPASVAWRQGRRAETDGDPRGAYPRLVGAVLGGLGIAVVVVQLVVNASSGAY